MLKAAVFDLDHTLFDRYATLTKIAPLFGTEFGFAPGVTAESFAKKFVQADKMNIYGGWEAIHAKLCREKLFQREPAFEEYRDFLLHSFYTAAVPLPFTKPMLRTLHEAGLLVGLITNGRHDLQTKKLKMLGIENCFDEKIISGDVAFQKPDCRIFELMAKRLSIKTSEMIYVGDHPKLDVEGSRKAGCIPVWVATVGYWAFPKIQKPEFCIDTVAEIPAVIQKIMKG